jgi:hypothetical protein
MGYRSNTVPGFHQPGFGNPIGHPLAKECRMTNDEFRLPDYPHAVKLNP